MALTLSPEVAKQILASLKRYAAEHFDEELGDLKASLLLDYLLRELGPVIYNKAIADAQSYFQGRVADLEGVCYEPEFTYWKDASGRRGKDVRKGPGGAGRAG